MIIRMEYYRRKKGITLHQLGKKIGYSKSSMSRIENYVTSPRLSTIEKIAAALQITPQQLLFGCTRVSCKDCEFRECPDRD